MSQDFFFPYLSNLVTQNEAKQNKTKQEGLCLQSLNSSGHMNLGSGEGSVNTRGELLL